MFPSSPLSPLSPTTAAGDGAAISRADLAAHLAGRLCHDLISPVSAVISGLDLLTDPAAHDMRADAMRLIDQSARKLAKLLSFARAAYGASGSADTFDPRELEELTRGLFSLGRAELDWAVPGERLTRPVTRVLLNLAQLGTAALPKGGIARLQVDGHDGLTAVRLTARGPRARLRPETLEGLSGLALTEGLTGQWIPGYYLYVVAADAAGRLETAAGQDVVTIEVRLPA
jgi:histidine phosphotransferase ChpT